MRRGAAGQSTEAEHRAYFQDQLLQSNIEFWRRFGREPDFAGNAVLDLGCGHGAMSIYAAQNGAHVLGVDLDTDRIEFAKRNVAEHHPELRDRVEFRAVDLVANPEERLAAHFDIVLSKDTFEHVDDVAAMLSAIAGLLKPNGELWAGFSPLYWSPYGDHGRTGLRLPWGHAVLPRRLVLTAASRYSRRPVARLSDIGLNGMTSSEFFRYAARAGLQVESALFNRGDKPFIGLFSRVRRVPLLERYFTVGIYTVMRRAGARSSRRPAE
jgi:SAM-dependent methyltransferase